MFCFFQADLDRNRWLGAEESIHPNQYPEGEPADVESDSWDSRERCQKGDMKKGGDTNEDIEMGPSLTEV